MGVQGLASFLDKHQNIYREVRFGRSRLLVDGCNLNYLLYFSSGLDQNHGGEYAAYVTLVESFIAALRSCDITPYVVLDGGSDVTDKKLETAAKRREDRIRKAHEAAASGRTMCILPRMAELVFIQTLARLQVPVAQCFAEADQEIAALASEWRCPVLSNDSDFFVFDLPGGFLPISHFHWREVRQSGSRSSVSCRRYYTSSFCSFFGLRRQLLPAFAALAGNDYVKLRGIDWTRFVQAGTGTEACGRLEGLLCWLKGLQESRGPLEVLEEALGLLGDLSGDKRELLQNLRLGMEEYQLGRSALSRFFLHGAPPEFPALEQEAGLVPGWMLLPVTQARLSGNVLDVLRLLRMNLGFGIETQELPSANQTSRPLRQVMYGLLLGKDRSSPVVEFDRAGLGPISVPVEPTFTRTSQRLRLDSLPQVALSDRLNVLLEALGVTQESLRLLPPQLQLPAAVSCYWLQTAQPPPDLQRALLLGMSNTPRSTAAFQNKSGIQKVDVDVSHAFSQWQACLKDAAQLNQLLGLPLPEPDVSRLYQGTLVHQLVHRMRSGGKLKTVLRSDRPSEELYRSLLSVVRRIRTRRTRQTRQKAATRRQQNPPEPSADLQRLFLQDEETESEARAAVAMQEELRLQEELLQVRTRYRTKERSNRSKNPDLARKEECRGRDLL
ncbi:single-strand DNA endonuclease ASTE1 [Poecilia reticulata]|uniref:Protein asteroid homolog 1-like n=1 Tax=Poecilia reticulata TaxID=8081 RepID=A0A3P9PJI5_POERE|nr:PREDICTED: protein asteroid homolog 1-like [Poecilia reticulata]